ncbi:DUF445 domain-containing protein [Neobacillus sp. PS3-34]|uniref:DUF445 domain-containing protein n=1 Tax=Neobacillus sp. PS3-34 TaxID=3070678 RepID=UPI0027DFBB25|nr:DUF445 domain-containing protein [Neobacillus sp. PS3-34]WML48298.1 DUF445 domain-containing protein [Neobacillus sp. PS3-34]
MLKRTKKSQYLASGSLAVMGAGFLATIPFQQTLLGAILQGGFEAGLVGGLADWFAVTALFRHPLGIPIPHTALLPKNRKRITATIISMLENDWLTKESIREKITAIPFTERIFPLIEREKGSEAVKKTILSGIKQVIQHIDITQLAPLIEKELKTQISQLEVETYLPRAIDQITARKYDEKGLDYILNEVEEWANKETTKERLGRLAVDAIENIKADGFMQFALKSFSSLVNEEKLGNIIQSLIQKGVKSFRDPYNSNRETLLLSVQTKLENIKKDENMINELNKIKTQFVDGWEPEEKILDFFAKLQQRALEVVDREGFFEEYILPMITKALDSLKNDEEKMEGIENWIRKHAFQFVDKNHSKIGKLVEENLNKLDDPTLISMLENNVGKDLQWIRVNGAICGFLIGLVLVGIKAIF